MEIDFDKDVDSLLRRAAARRRERASFEISPQTEEHLDADQLNAFAENSLPIPTLPGQCGQSFTVCGA